MTLAISNETHSYLDVQELATLLRLSTRTVRMRVKYRPWLLPPRAKLRDLELLRWRQDVVIRWLMAVNRVRSD
jgi:hypothetical protein